MPNSPLELRRKIATAFKQGDVAVAELMFELFNTLENVPNGSTLEVANKMVENITRNLKGEKGDRYMLTNSDKKEIATLVLGEVDRKSLVKEILSLIDIPLEKIAKEAALLVPKPKDGLTPSKAQLESMIVDLLPKVDEEGISKKTSKIVLEEFKKSAQKDHDEIKEALEELEDRIEDKLEKMSEATKNSVASKGASLGGFSGRDLFTDIDISDQLDSSTKTFNIQATYNIITVDLSSFPYGSLRKNIDYTYTPTTITFTDEIDASTQLATGQSCIITAVIA